MVFRYLLGIPLAAMLVACGTSTPPEREIPVVRLSGTPEEMGRQHGAALRDEIRTLYVRFLDAQVLPYLNRQQVSVDQTFLGLAGYTTNDEYQNGQFAYRFLLDSAETLAAEQPDDYLAELKGIAEGSGLSEEKITVLNTFGDTLLGLLALSFYTERNEAPKLISVTLPGKADGRDNDFDGAIDNAAEEVVYFEPATLAVRTGIPPGKVSLVIQDLNGVQTEHLQLLVNGQAVPESERTIAEAATEVTISFDTASYWRDDWNTIAVQASDKTELDSTLPAHPRTMRQARLTIGGLKAKGRETNAGFMDPPGAATSFSIAADDGSVVARNFVLLDGNTAHDHAAVFVFDPAPTKENPKPQKYAVVGWSGALWALTGMNDAGQSVTVNITETLDNGVARGIDNAVLPKAVGITFGAVGRYVLSRDLSPADFAAAMDKFQGASGVIVQLADSKRKTVTTCELRAGISGTSSACYGTETTGPAFRLTGNYTSTFSAYRAFANDATGSILEDLSAIEVVPQRYWSTEWLQSYSTYGRLQRLLGKTDPGDDVAAWLKVMRTPGIASLRNSMHSAIIFPGKEMWVGAGRLPSVDSRFQRFTVKELFQ